jgi:hypothetical protein
LSKVLRRRPTSEASPFWSRRTLQSEDVSYLGFNLLGLIVEGFEEEADLGGLALLVEEDADSLHLGGEVLAAGQREANVVCQEHPTLRPEMGVTDIIWAKIYRFC